MFPEIPEIYLREFHIYYRPAATDNPEEMPKAAPLLRGAASGTAAYGSRTLVRSSFMWMALTFTEVPGVSVKTRLQAVPVAAA